MNAYPHRCRLLADTLRDYLTRGVRLSGETMHFIEATFAVTDAADLSALLSESENSETDSLLELIFYPDPPMQQRIEDLLAAHRFTHGDLSIVTRCLSDPPVYARLIFPEGRGELIHRPASTVLAPMVDRLHISRVIAAPILAACRRFTPRIALGIRIQIRNAKTAPAGNVVEFIATFLANADFDVDEILACLATALELTENLPDNDIYEGLVRIKRDLAETLDRSDRMVRSAAGRNIETLMLTGVRLPHIDKKAVQERIRRINRLCRTAFGRIDHGAGAVNAVDLGCFAPDRDLTDLVRRLS